MTRRIAILFGCILWVSAGATAPVVGEGQAEFREAGAAEGTVRMVRG
jgi:hypothetical protein